MNWNGMRLAHTPEERQRCEYEADLYSLIVSIEKLEKAHLRFLVSESTFQTTMKQLLGKFSDLCDQMDLPTIDAVDKFMRKYRLTCPAAKNRITLGSVSPGAGSPSSRTDKPNTSNPAEAQQRSAVNPKYVLEVGQLFITLLDSLKLGQNAKDQIQPLLSDLIDALERGLKDFEEIPQLKMWHGRLEAMRASDELDAESARDMAYDVERGYNLLHKVLQRMS
eukprot:PhM_4_TR19030/c0_g1_i1/m.67208/K12184/VPS28; ESCRT-I complex subunit VPS28